MNFSFPTVHLIPLLSNGIQQSCSVVWYKWICCVHFLNVKLLPFLCHLQLPTQTIPPCITTWHRFHQFQAQAELYVVMCDGFSTDCWGTCWHRDIWILHHASICPPPLCKQRPTGLADLMPSFFLSLSSSSFFIPPYLSLPAVPLIHYVPGASPSLSVREKQSPTSLTLDSDLVPCLCTGLSLRESDSRTRLTHTNSTS